MMNKSKLVFGCTLRPGSIFKDFLIQNLNFKLKIFNQETQNSIFILNTVILGLNIWFFRDYLRSKTYSFEYKSIQIRYSQNEILHSTWLEFMKGRDLWTSD